MVTHRPHAYAHRRALDGATNQRLVAEAGLQIISAQEAMADEDGAPVTFLWVVARKP
jgi:hypothetical protein